MAEFQVELPELPDTRETLDLDFIESMRHVIAQLEARVDELLSSTIEFGKPFPGDEYRRTTALQIDAVRLLNRYRGEVAVHITVAEQQLPMPEKVARWLRLAERAYCDECIATEFGLNKIHEAKRISQTLSADEEFVRFRGVCAACGQDKLVTQNV